MLDNGVPEALRQIRQLLAAAVNDHQLMLVLCHLGQLSTQMLAQLGLTQNRSTQFDDQDHAVFTASTNRSASRAVIVKGGIIRST